MNIDKKISNTWHIDGREVSKMPELRYENIKSGRDSNWIGFAIHKIKGVDNQLTNMVDIRRLWNKWDMLEEASA